MHPRTCSSDECTIDMKNLIDAVELYLKTTETDYAILIKGEWGCGKTHFYKNVLSKRITKLGYKPVYISLFGIADSVELSLRLFLEVNPKVGSLLKSKAGQKVSGLTKVVLGSLSFHGLKLDIGKLNLKDWISLKGNYLLCFDDLERTVLGISEVFGYINNFIEHDKCKVLMIANENEIKKDDSYWRLKEKIFGYTVEYVPNIDNVLTTIIESFKDAKLRSFLTQHKNTILQMLQNRKLLNIRILKHALQSYKFIHDYLIEQKKESLNNFGVRLLLFTLSVSYAVKSGNDAIIEELKMVSSTVDFELKMHFSDEKRKNKSELKDFYERLYDSIPYGLFFSRSVLDYILNGFFNADTLGYEIKAEMKEVEDPITKSIRTLFYEWFELSDSEFEALIENVLNYVREGKIGINLYPTIFSSISYFSQQRLIREENVNLVEFFKQGLKKAYELMSTSYDGTKSLTVLGHLSESEPSKEYEEIKKVTEQYIGEIEGDWFRKKVENIFELLPEKIEEFSTCLLDEKEHCWSKPIFKYYSMEKLSEKLKQANNKTRVIFRRLLDRRYKGIQNIQELIYEDADNLRKLSELLKSYSTEKEQKLGIVLLKKIGETAQEYSEILSKYAAKPTTPQSNRDNINQESRYGSNRHSSL
jgi:hypothetical protein